MVLTEDIAENRQRAPLGMKTTNAKSRAFATPAPTLAEKALSDAHSEWVI